MQSCCRRGRLRSASGDQLRLSPKMLLHNRSIDDKESRFRLSGTSPVQADEDEIDDYGFDSEEDEDFEDAEFAQELQRLEGTLCQGG